MNLPSARIRWAIRFLRFIAICQMLAFVAVFAPIESWLQPWYSWVYLGKAPEVSAILRYVVRATAYFQGAIGLWLWVMTSDVIRYRPLIMTTGVVYLIAGFAFLGIDATAGLPVWWWIYDSAYCLGVAVALFTVGQFFPVKRMTRSAEIVDVR